MGEKYLLDAQVRRCGLWFGDRGWSCWGASCENPEAMLIPASDCRNCFHLCDAVCEAAVAVVPKMDVEIRSLQNQNFVCQLNSL